MIPSYEEIKEEMGFDANYFIVAYTNTEDRLVVYHIVGYENKPSDDVLESLKQELAEDEDFKLDQEILDVLLYVNLTKEEYIYFREVLKGLEKEI
jgi:hypothetical protein